MSVILPRALIDFAAIQICMAVAVQVSILYHDFTADPGTLINLAHSLAHYYWRVFVPLSFVFTVLLFVCGLYTEPLSHRRSRRIWSLVKGCGISLLVFFASNYMLFRQTLPARSVLIVFAILVTLALVSLRILKTPILTVFHKPSVRDRGGTAEGRVLVIGGAGYIGSILVRKLLAQGRSVRVLDSMVYGDHALRGVLDNPKLELIVGDCRNIQHVIKAVKNVDSIVLLAAIVGDPACEMDHETALEINYAATRMIIEVTKGHGVERLVFASSCSVYGATDELMTEKSSVRPISCYAQTKVDSEIALLDGRREHFHPTILRLSTVFGMSHRPRFDLVVNLLTAKAHQHGVITVYNGEQWRPFIHVDDVCEGFITVLNAPLAKVSGQVFNLGDSRLNYTLSSISEKIKAEFPDVKVEHIENSDPRNYRVSFDKIKSTLGFQCHRVIEDGIRELKTALRDGTIRDYTDVYYNNQRYLQKNGSPAAPHELDRKVMAAFGGTPHVAAVSGAAAR
jgi:nucleoside-diphosphate-sugar epimerase